MEGLLYGGAYLRGEICISKSIGLALLLEVNLSFLICFTLYFRAIFQVQGPGGLIFGGAIKRRVFCVTSLGALYLEGLILGILRYFDARKFCCIFLLAILKTNPFSNHLSTKKVQLHSKFGLFALFCIQYL